MCIDLSEVIEESMGISKVRPFQAEGTVSAKAPSQVHAWQV